MKKYMKKFHFINIIIILTLIITPLSVLASLPTTTDFDRHNYYPTDGFRAGGYHAVRDNAIYDGYMNMSHTGGTREFNIDTYNIKNVTLDFDLMFERRSFLFGWGDVTWQDAVDSLNGRIFINITTDGTLNSMRFVDQPNVYVRVLKDGEVYRGWNRLSDTEIDTNGFEAGSYEVIIEFQDLMTTFDIVEFLLEVLLIVGVILVIYNTFRRTMFGDGGEYYRRVWK